MKYLMVLLLLGAFATVYTGCKAKGEVSDEGVSADVDKK
jgi:hypothetical protein